jgi:hypothetical protein|tara:strand:+ start:344 stop:514 length:171 start_codon:yes stop_codon:yes gene_type:complete
MKVKELLKQLKQYNSDAIVRIVNMNTSTDYDIDYVSNDQDEMVDYDIVDIFTQIGE